MANTHFGFESVDEKEKARRVRGVFDSVAESYDLMNDLMSGGMHRLWKRFALSQTGLRPGQRALDVASGTGDLGAGVARQVGRDGLAVLTDINREMLARGRDRLIDKGFAAHVEFVIANVENSAAGFGVTKDIGDSIVEWGVDVMTSGNHIWDKKEVLDYIPTEPRLLRPANYPAGVPGRGAYVAQSGDGRSVGVINVMGRVFMLNIDDPFTTVVREIESVRERTPLVVVDFHAEATSEKIAMGWHVAGKVTAIVGTHTHVQTADNRILPGGTAYITDVGMTGPHDGIIGVEREPALARFLNAMPARFDTASGDLRLHAVVIAADAETGRASAITRLSLSLADLHALSGATYDEAGTPGAR